MTSVERIFIISMDAKGSMRYQDKIGQAKPSLYNQMDTSKGSKSNA
jgi:hypothetical protein